MKQLHPLNSQEWNALLLRFPDAHILQTWQWAEAKEQNDWKPLYFAWGADAEEPEALALILERQIRLPGMRFSVLYSPKGPVFPHDSAYANPKMITRIIRDLEDYARKTEAIFLKIDPDVLLGTGIPDTDEEEPNPFGIAFQKGLQKRGWQFSQDQIQFRNTVLIDLRQDEGTLLAAMKQKTRYNVRLAARKGVTIRQGSIDELPMLYTMYAETAVRDDFVIRHEDYYLNAWRAFMEADMAKILIAEVESEPIAALILFHFNGMARYMYGMSTERYRELMPNYLLQWEAMRLSKELGCHTYDMWGAPDVFDESDSMWGVFRFKQGFNGTTTRYLGAWDFTTRPLFYLAYTRLLPRILDIMRRRGKADNRKQVGIN